MRSDRDVVDLSTRAAIAGAGGSVRGLLSRLLFVCSPTPRGAGVCVVLGVFAVDVGLAASRRRNGLI